MANGEPEVSVTVVNPPEGTSTNAAPDSAAIVAAEQTASAAEQAESAADSARAAASEAESATGATTEAAAASVSGAEIATEAADEAVSAAESIVAALNDLPGRIAAELTKAAQEAKGVVTESASTTEVAESGPTQQEITAGDKPPTSQHWLTRSVGKRKK